MTDDKTIKQLADELGVSKQAIRKHIDKLPPTLLVTKKGNTIFLSAEVSAYIKSNIRVRDSISEKKVPSNVGGNSDKVSGNVTRNLDNKFLEKQLLAKDKQLEEKDNQIKSLHKLLDQQQILTLQANKKIEELELKNESEEKIKSENNHAEEKKSGDSEQNFPSTEVEKEKNNSTSFWKKLFRKEK